MMGMVGGPSVEETTKPENLVAYKQWMYTLELCEYMYADGLLDRQEFLQFVLEVVEKCRYPDDPAMRMIMPVLLQYAKEFTESQLLSRKLAYQCAKKITQLVSETDAICPCPPEGPGLALGGNGANESSENQHHPEASSSDGNATLATQHHQLMLLRQSNMNPVLAAFFELLNDPYTRFIVLGLSTIVQTITLECPSALVWHYFGGDNKSPSSLMGSPLDYLPNCAPSGLPMPETSNNRVVRLRIKRYEDMVKQRSACVEGESQLQGYA